MQVVWSRAAQARSPCHCSSCLQFATKAARRVTTAASKRQLKAGDVFTACYSTILGTAAFVDARVKQDRRRELDRVIAEAKADLSMDEPNGIRKTGPPMDWPMKIHQEDLASDPLIISTRKSSRIASNWSSTRWTRQFSSPILEAQIKDLDLRLDEALDLKTKIHLASGGRSVGEASELDHRNPKTRFQTEMLENMIVKLVARMLHEMEGSAQRGATMANKELITQKKQLIEKLISLQQRSSSLPSYVGHEHLSSKKQELSGLHDSLTRLFEKTIPGSSDIDIMLGKVCYNLLISKAPPTITTYDIMMQHFLRLGQFRLSGIMADSFLNESRFRPTSKTTCLLLQHYAAMNDIFGFRKIVARMRAADGDMRIKRRHISELGSPTEQQWACSHKIMHRDGFYSQKAFRNTEVFDALIQGCLKLSDPASAIRYFRAALREGQRINSTTLGAVIEACVLGANEKLGRSLLSTILSEWQNESLGPNIQYCARMRYHIYQLLDFCGLFSLETALRANLDNHLAKVSAVSLQRLLFHMRLEKVGEALEMVSKSLSHLQKLLSQPGEHGALKVDTALKFIESISTGGSRKHRNPSHGLRMRIRALEAHTTSKIAKVTEYSELLLDIVYPRLSPSERRVYEVQVEKKLHMSILDRLELAIALIQTRGQPTSKRLEKVISSTGLENQSSKEVSLDLEGVANPRLGLVASSATGPMATRQPRDTIYLSRGKKAPTLSQESGKACLFPLGDAHERSSVSDAAG